MFQSEKSAAVAEKTVLQNSTKLTEITRSFSKPQFTILFSLTYYIYIFYYIIFTNLTLLRMIFSVENILVFL